MSTSSETTSAGSSVASPPASVYLRSTSSETNSLESSGATLPAKPIKRRRRYKQSAWRCEKCRLAHRRCIHDRPDAPPLPSVQQPSEEGKTIQVAILPKQEDLSATRIQDPSTLSCCPIIATNREMTELATSLFSVPPMDAKFWRSNTPDLLDNSPGFRFAITGFYLLHRGLQEDKRTALEYIQAAIVRLRSRFESEVNAQGFVLCLTFFLAMSSFAMQEPVERFALHSKGARSIVMGYFKQLTLPPFLAGLLREENIRPVITQEAYNKHKPEMEPFERLFPTVNFCKDWYDGNIVDLVSIMFDAASLMDSATLQTLTASVVYNIIHRLHRHQAVQHEFDLQQSLLAQLTEESIYVICMHHAYRDRRIPVTLVDGLRTKVRLAERTIGQVPFVLRVLQAVEC
ncbi:hypothetical protein BCR37DRAFT_162815 [Protomyces lactucae-debilis]|uniref:Uncharacterized protein n=1 Tax=Protomyces lactucae-debilis TaxID=2754530 RepID=A0A1Y2EYX8_PROLT|nr:uncharacterized protein BCR37DRAFT_162815 [Protomyces lactucae-debilis]ORY76697.1 hypothetical protein BCR37DRAFT_162815 [Protomyces lactucae-debilis]